MVCLVALSGCATMIDEARENQKSVIASSILPLSSNPSGVDFSIDGLPYDQRTNAWSEWWLFGQSGIERVQLHRYDRGLGYDDRYSIVDQIPYEKVDRVEVDKGTVGFGTVPIIKIYSERSNTPKGIYFYGIVEIDGGVPQKSIHREHDVEGGSSLDYALGLIRDRL